MNIELKGTDKENILKHINRRLLHLEKRENQQQEYIDERREYERENNTKILNEHGGYSLGYLSGKVDTLKNLKDYIESDEFGV